MEDSKFLVLGTEADWKAGMSKSIEILEDGSLSLAGVPALLQRLEKPGLGFPAGLAIDRCGFLYVVDSQNCRLYLYDPELKEIGEIECIGGCGSLPVQFRSPKGIAVDNSNLYVADTGNHRVQVFFLPNFQLRYILGSTDAWSNPVSGNGAVEFSSPWALALDRHGNLYVVDRGDCRIQKFSMAGKYLLEFGKDELEDPMDIAIDSHGFLYVLDVCRRRVLKFDREGRFLGVVVDLDGREPVAIALSNKSLYVADSKSLKICKFDESGAYLAASEEYQGKCHGLAMDRWGNLYASMGETGEIALFREGVAFVPNGFHISRALDCGIEGCRWHKLLLEADIPSGTRLEVSYYSSDEEKQKDDIKKLPASAWSEPIVNPEDSLIHAQGRYLWLKIIFSGDEHLTPHIRRIRAYYPRMSYLRYLPATYQEDATSRDFLERFLSLFETFLSHTEDEICKIPAIFDPMAVSSDFLPWLSSWLAFAVDENWPEDKKRKLILNAMDLYKKRGTKEGLSDFIGIYSGDRPIILEHFQFRPPEKPFEKYAHRFSVILYTSHVKTAKQRKAIESIIEAEKPAHTHYYIRVIEKSMQIGVLSRIGIDTIVGRHPVMTLGILSTVGVDSVVGCDDNTTGRIGMNSKLGITTVIS